VAVFTLRSYSTQPSPDQFIRFPAVCTITHLHIDFVAAQHNRDALAHAFEIPMPVRHVLVRDPRGHVEHDDAALALNVVPIAQATELLLSGGIPHIEDNITKVGVELQRVDFHTERGCGTQKREMKKGDGVSTALIVVA
jgi:hypothetical protein